MKLLKYIFLAALVYLACQTAWRFIRRKLRGEPKPQRNGPRTSTLLAVAVVLAYGVMLALQLAINH